MLGDAHFGPTPFRIDPNALEVIAASLRQRQVMAQRNILCARFLDNILVCVWGGVENMGIVADFLTR